MKNLFSSIAVVSLTLLLTSTPVHSQDATSVPPSLSSIPVPPVPSGEPDVGSAISPMRRGQRAPFTGVLLSPASVATVITLYKTLPDTIKLETDRAVALCEARGEKKSADERAECARSAAVDASRLKTVELENSRLKTAVEEAEKKDSNRLSGSTWFGLGAASGAGVVVGILLLLL